MYYRTKAKATYLRFVLVHQRSNKVEYHQGLFATPGAQVFAPSGTNRQAAEQEPDTYMKYAIVAAQGALRDKTGLLISKEVMTTMPHRLICEGQNPPTKNHLHLIFELNATSMPQAHFFEKPVPG